jgi:hypothetical protein
MVAKVLVSATKFVNSCQGGENVLMRMGIMFKGNDTSAE